MITARAQRKKHRDIPKLPASPSQVKVGFPEGDAEGDIVDRAIWTHYGTQGGASGGGWGGPVPSRPFLMNAIENNKSKYRKTLRVSASQILRGTTTMNAVLSKLGLFAQGHIQSEITNLQSPPNSQATIDLKGSSNPLIDSGEMRGAVTYKVDD